MTVRLCRLDSARSDDPAPERRLPAQCVRRVIRVNRERVFESRDGVGGFPHSEQTDPARVVCAHLVFTPVQAMRVRKMQLAIEFAQRLRMIALGEADQAQQPMQAEAG